MNAWVLHRDETIFGPDAHIFRPERWLGTKEEIAPLEKRLFTVSTDVLLHLVLQRSDHFSFSLVLVPELASARISVCWN
jgi:cytochrome P450